MNVADLDRPVHDHHYPPWDRTVQLRAITARQLVDLNDRFHDHLADDDPGAALAFYAALLALTVTEPAATENEWLECTQGTLLELGAVAMRISGLDTETAKKNSPDP